MFSENPAQDSAAEAMADAVTVLDAANEAVISAPALKAALATLGIPVALHGLEATATGNEPVACMALGMSQVIDLLLDVTELVIARDELAGL